MTRKHIYTPAEQQRHHAGHRGEETKFKVHFVKADQRLSETFK